jgi:hypothetical protein
MPQGCTDLISCPTSVPLDVYLEDPLHSQLWSLHLILRKSSHRRMSSHRRPEPERRDQKQPRADRVVVTQDTCGAIGSAIEGEGFSNLIVSLKNIRSTVPVGPFLCLAKMS